MPGPKPGAGCDQNSAPRDVFSLAPDILAWLWPALEHCLVCIPADIFLHHHRVKAGGNRCACKNAQRGSCNQPLENPNADLPQPAL